VRVLITGGAGQIAYSLIFAIASGKMLGSDTPIILHLLDIEAVLASLKGVVLELEDCAYPLLQGVVATANLKVAFSDVDIALLVGAFPRAKGMERKDLLAKNATIFREHGQALNDFASPNVKVLVVGNPANTNCLLALKFAPKLKPENFTALTRLDHNRALAQIAQKTGVPVRQVSNVIIWGNHSSTQYADPRSALIATGDGRVSGARVLINDDNWIRTTFLKTVQDRGAAVIAARKLSSAASAANAIVDHIHDWVLGTKAGVIVSMGIVSDGSYGVPKGLIYSYPVTCSSDGKWSIVRDLPIDQFSRSMMDATAKELVEERDTALAFLNSTK